MENEPDEGDKEQIEAGPQKNARRRCGVWNPSFVKKFTNLIKENTVLLQATHKYPKSDPIHELRAKALEHMRVEMGMQTVEDVKQRMTAFRKFAANKLKQCADKCEPNAKPETILKAAPPWLRAVESHLMLWSQVTNNKRRCRAKPVVVPSNPKPASPKPECIEMRGARLTMELATHARQARSLDADVVCRLPSVPEERAEELKYVWWKMLSVVREKLKFQCDGGDIMKVAQLSPVELLLSDTVLLFDDTITTLPDSTDYDCLQSLVVLFHLAQLYRLEGGGAALAARWRRALRVYRNRTPQTSGICNSIILLQRRWHELKHAARVALVQYSRKQAEPTPLHAAIARRFPHVVTSPLPSWKELVESGQVVEEEQLENSEEEPTSEEMETELEGISLLSPEDLEPYEKTAKEEEDDLILIEREIETIDLINVADESNVNLRKRSQRAMVASLERQLDRQLLEIGGHAGASETDLSAMPVGEPVLLYETDDDLECIEDKNTNIENIAKEILSEETVVKQESVDSDDADDVAIADVIESIQIDSDDDEHAQIDDEHEDQEECDKIDSKLLMDVRVTLPRLDAAPEWKRVASRPRINLALLDLRKFSPKEAMLDITVAVKVEKIEQSDIPSGERQVKTMAKRLISEIMQDENEDTSDRNKATKKIKLPSIEEVRKNNQGILTAQVAPLASVLPEPKTRTISIDSTADLQIDECETDVSMSRKELEKVLTTLSRERGYKSSGRPGPASRHCCTARRQGALNAARRRLAARSGRQTPPFMDIHTSSSCTKECKCCCKHLLQNAESSSRLQREAAEIAQALRRVLGEEASPDVASTSKKAISKKPRPKVSNKKSGDQPVPDNIPKEDPLQEWIRQKSVNQQYFNLNLNKPEKPTKPDIKEKTTPEPDIIEITTPEPDIIEITTPEPDNKEIITPHTDNLKYTLTVKDANTINSEIIDTLEEPKPEPIVIQNQMKMIYYNPQLMSNKVEGNNRYIIVPALQPSKDKLPTITPPISVNLNSAILKTISPTKPATDTLQKITIPISTEGKVINLYKVTNEKKTAQLQNQVMHRKILPLNTPQQPATSGDATGLNKKTVVFSFRNKFGKIMTNQANHKTLVLTPEEQARLKITPSKLSTPINTQNNEIMQMITTEQGKILISPSQIQARVPSPTKIVKQPFLVTTGVKGQNPTQDQGTLSVNPSGNLNTRIMASPNNSQTSNSNLPPLLTHMPIIQNVFSTAKPTPRTRKLKQQDEKGLLTKAKTTRNQSTISRLPTKLTRIAPKPVTDSKDGSTDLGSNDSQSHLTQTNESGWDDSGTNESGLDDSETNESGLDESGLDDELIWTGTNDAGSSSGAAVQPRGILAPVSKISTISLNKDSSHDGPPGEAPKSKKLVSDQILKALEEEASNSFNLAEHYKRRDFTIALDKYIGGRTTMNLSILVVDPSSDYLTFRRAIGDSYILLTQTDLGFQNPEYWAMTPPRNAPRIEKEKKLVAGPELAPEKMTLGGQIYLKLMEEPLTYAKAYFVVRSASEALGQLRRGRALQMFGPRAGLTPVLRDKLLPNTFALRSPNAQLSAALARVLDQELPAPRQARAPAQKPPALAKVLSLEEPPAPAPAPDKLDAKTRAEVAIKMNYENRKPIEMVYIDSDDDGDVQKKFDFKGLEKFEELDDFDL